MNQETKAGIENLYWQTLVNDGIIVVHEHEEPYAEYLAMKDLVVYGTFTSEYYTGPVGMAVHRKSTAFELKLLKDVD